MSVLKMDQQTSSTSAAVYGCRHVQHGLNNTVSIDQHAGAQIDTMAKELNDLHTPKSRSSPTSQVPASSCCSSPHHLFKDLLACVSAVHEVPKQVPSHLIMDEAVAIQGAKLLTAAEQEEVAEMAASHAATHGDLAVLPTEIDAVPPPLTAARRSQVRA